MDRLEQTPRGDPDSEKVPIRDHLAKLVRRPGMRCHSCCRGVPRTNEGMCQPAEPLGSCRKCSAFACGYHGAWAEGTFRCIRCDGALQLRSAGENDLNRYHEWFLAQGGAEGSVGDPARTGFALALTTADPNGDGPPVRSLATWASPRGAYGGELQALQGRWVESFAAIVTAIAADRAHVVADPLLAGLLAFWNASAPENRELFAAGLMLALATRSTTELPAIATACARSLAIPLSDDLGAPDAAGRPNLLTDIDPLGQPR